MITEKEYNDITSKLPKALEPINNRLLKITIPEYNYFLTKDGKIDKRKKYFKIKILLTNNEQDENSIFYIGEQLIKIGNYVKRAGNDRIYIVSQIIPFYNALEVEIKFISYVTAAKTLLLS